MTTSRLRRSAVALVADEVHRRPAAGTSSPVSRRAQRRRSGDEPATPPRGFGSVRVAVRVGATVVADQRAPGQQERSLRAAGEDGRAQRRGPRAGDPVAGQPRRAGRRVSVPRLVATDLDGTLVRTDGSVSDRTRAVLAEPGGPWRARACFVDRAAAAVDGRALADASARTVSRIVSNGAIVLRRGTARLRAELHGIGRDVGLALAAGDPRRACPGATFAVETLAGIAPRPDVRRQPASRRRRGSPRGRLAELWTDPAVKLLAPARRARTRSSSGRR